MRKLSEIKNEDALDVLAEIIEPTAAIFADKKLTAMIAENKAPIKSIKYAIKEHRAEVIQILAALNEQNVEDYNANPVSILVQLMEVVNDKELLDFFNSQRQMME